MADVKQLGEQIVGSVRGLIQRAMERVEERVRKLDDEVTALSELIVKMPPQAGGEIMSQMSDPDAHAILLAIARKDPRKAAGILAQMPATRAAQLSQQYLNTESRVAGSDDLIPIDATTTNKDDARAQRIMQLNGVGEITASAIVSTVGDASVFKNGRQFAAWVGLTPREYSTGGKQRLGHISKRGDVYLRTLLVHGARSELMLTHKRSDKKSVWAEKLKTTKSWNKTAVALANKHARIIWALLTKQENYHAM